ncbi:cytochrome P450 2J5-like isoform X2 [Elgaria multicarinata webbii]|uniref:cytochrome P450 2J5-like isoform X2 n=1 Tax=Elgaria multicarinata webbii TaxID=159646 RepID=UPI002FCD64F7
MMGIRALLIALLVALLILVFLRQLWSRRHYPPGPLFLPIIGGMWELGIKLHEDTFIKIVKKYGNICCVWLGHQPMICVSGLQAVKEALITHKELSERPLTPFFKIFGREMGLLASNGHTWKQQRRFALVTLRKLGLGKKGMEHQIQEEAQQLVESFARAKGQPLDPSLPITNAVSNVICAVTFGHRFSLEDEKFQKMIEAIDVVLKFIGTISHVLYEMFPWIMNHLPGPHKKTFSAHELVLSHAREEIEKHKEQHSFHEPRDYIDFYLLQMEKSRNDPNSTYDEENLAQCIHDLLFTGTETTAASLKWALLLLTNHPDIQDKVYKEIEDVFGSSRSICYQDIKELPYTNAVIHEMQRSKYILLFGGARQCTKDVKLNGYLIPKGAYILPNLRSVLFDPELWKTPEEFNPNHFLDKDGNFVDREEFLVFSTGARVCLAEQLARIEIFIFLTSLLRAFRFQLPKGVKKLRPDPIIGFTFHPHPYKICAVPRCC